MRFDAIRLVPIYPQDAPGYWARACEGLDPPDAAFGPEWRVPRPRASERYFLAWHDPMAPGKACGDGALGLVWTQRASPSTVTFGMGLWKEYRGRGWGHLVRDAIYAFVFEDLTVYKLQSEVYASNRQSLGALHGRYARSREEGRQRETIRVQGIYYDRILFGITRGEWHVQLSAEASGVASAQEFVPYSRPDNAIGGPMR